jgi:hypothetical protein
MVKTISRKNVKYIVQVSQTGLKRKKKKPNAPESAEGKKKKSDRKNTVKYNWRSRIRHLHGTRRKKEKKSSNEKHKQQAVKLYKKMVKKDRRYEVEE